MTIGVLGVAGALVLGGLLLYAVLTAALTRTVQASALSSAREVALLVETNRLPDPVPVSGAQVVQVIDAQGRVVSGSPTADRLTAPCSRRTSGRPRSPGTLSWCRARGPGCPGACRSLRWRPTPGASE